MDYKNEEEFLKDYDVSLYKQLSLTTDIAVLSVNTEENSDCRKSSIKRMSVLLVKRDEYPYKDMWCLPGGFIGYEEELEDCPVRILENETGVKNIYLEQLYTFGSVNRDPRTRVVSTSYMALIDKNKLDSKLNKNAAWFDITYFEDKSNVHVVLTNLELNKTLKFVIKKTLKEKTTDRYKFTIEKNNDFAFDHPIVIWCAIERLKSKCMYTDIVFNMMPKLFTLGDLQRVYEVILNKKLLDPAFRRIINKKVIKTKYSKADGGHRPSYLYKYKG